MTMRGVSLLACLCLLQACLAAQFSMESCNSNAAVTFRDVSVSPHPIRFPGNVKVSGTMDVLSSLSGDLTVDLTIKKKLGFFYLRIPCIKGVGSCKYKNVCSYLTGTCPPQIAGLGLPCSCPIDAGTYSLNGESFQLPQTLKKFANLAKGSYKITAKLTDESSKRSLACQQISVSLSAAKKKKK